METNFFENTQYKNKFTRKSLLLEIRLTENTTNYTLTLPEELKIDNFSEVFVDTVVTNNIEINSVSRPDNLGMLLKIDGIISTFFPVILWNLFLPIFLERAKIFSKYLEFNIL